MSDLNEFENDDYSSLTILTPPKAGGAPPFFLLTPVPMGKWRCALTYFSGHAIHTHWWFTHRKNSSGYPAATYYVGRSLFILKSE